MLSVHVFRVGESDPLLTRLVIMVDGRFRCLGSPAYLKNKFGDVRAFKVRLLTTDKAGLKSAAFKEYIAEKFPETTLWKESLVELTYVSDDRAVVMQSLEFVKEQFDIEYTIGEATLDEVFLKFARKSNKSNKCNIMKAAFNVFK